MSFTVNEADAVILLVNTASDPVLDYHVALDRRAVQAIFEARPITSDMELAELSLEELCERGLASLSRR